MADNRGVLILGEDAILKGEVKGAERVEVWGYVEGGVTASEVVVAEGGKLYGALNADTAEINGTMQGEARVLQLIRISSTGHAIGKIKYGRLAIEEGGELTAHVRNIPPAIGGDLDLSVARGRTVRITTADLTALDPDDRPENLTFHISNAAGGFVALAAAPAQGVASFSQSDLEGGGVLFAHDGSSGDRAVFDVTVTDLSGASSGRPQTVNVAVRG
jgi:cytoskeletal protein CcmA (bactofilin family)